MTKGTLNLPFWYLGTQIKEVEEAQIITISNNKTILYPIKSERKPEKVYVLINSVTLFEKPRSHHKYKMQQVGNLPAIGVVKVRNKGVKPLIKLISTSVKPLEAIIKGMKGEIVCIPPP